MIITFGEVLMRLAPPEFQRFAQAKSFDVIFGGAEANTAVSLAQFGQNVSHVTKLPSNDIGRLCQGELARYNVNTKEILMDKSNEARLGLYFCEKGASQRPSKVIYDRANSSIALAKSDDFDWDSIFKDAKWFHFTGITPAISDNLADILLTACKVAKKKGITVSCDLNYRAKLWTREKAKKVMTTYMPYTDVLIANTGSIYDVFDINIDNSDMNNDSKTSAKVAKKIKELFGINTIAMTIRESISASKNNWSAMIYADKEYVSKRYEMDIVDRIGGGDSFDAGLIYSLVNKFDYQKSVEFATAASCLKHTIQGDFNLVSVEEVLNLANGNSARIKR